MIKKSFCQPPGFQENGAWAWLGMAQCGNDQWGHKIFAIFTEASIFGCSGPSFGAIATSAMHQSVIGPADV